jgi:predicted RNase H-like HicB family nuclease
MNYTIETEQEDDGRWIAEVMELPGVIVYGQTRSDAIQSAEDLARRVIADRLAGGEPDSELAREFEGETVPMFPSIARTSPKLSIVIVAFSTFALLKIAVVASYLLAYKDEIDLCAAFALACSVVALIPLGADVSPTWFLTLRWPEAMVDP